VQWSFSEEDIIVQIVPFLQAGLYSCNLKIFALKTFYYFELKTFYNFALKTFIILS